MQLPEHHFLFGTILHLTLADPPLHRPAEAAGVLTGIFILQHFQQGRGHQSGSFLQQGNKLDVPDGLKRIFTRPPVTITGFRPLIFSILRPERTEIPAFMAEICWVTPFYAESCNN